MSRGVADAQLRVWAPQGAQVLFVRQVSPTVEDLTSRRGRGEPADRRLPDRRLGRRVPRLPRRRPAGRPRPIGQEQLAARVQLAVGDEVVAQGLVKAKWSDDDELTTRIDPAGRPLHRPDRARRGDPGGPGGQGGRRRGDRDHQARPGRPARRGDRQRGGHRRLRKVVDIEDVDTGTVRLKRAVDKADEMALDTASTKTTAGPQVSMKPAPNGHESAADRLLRRLRGADAADAARRCRGSRAPRPGDTSRLPVRRPRDAGGRRRPGLPELRAPNVADALFCEACGYDFTTGTMPRTAAGAAADADADAAAPLRRRRRARQHAPAAGRRRLGGGALDRPGLVRRAGQPRPAALARAAGRRPAAATPRCWSAGSRAAATSIPTSTAATTTASAAGRPS